MLLFVVSRSKIEMWRALSGRGTDCYSGAFVISTSSVVTGIATAAAFTGATGAIWWLRSKLNEIAVESLQLSAMREPGADSLSKRLEQVRKRLRRERDVSLENPEALGGFISPSISHTDTQIFLHRETAAGALTTTGLDPLPETGISEAIISPADLQHEMPSTVDVLPASTEPTDHITPPAIPATVAQSRSVVLSPLDALAEAGRDSHTGERLPAQIEAPFMGPWTLLHTAGLRNALEMSIGESWESLFFNKRFNMKPSHVTPRRLKAEEFSFMAPSDVVFIDECSTMYSQTAYSRALNAALAHQLDPSHSKKKDIGKCTSTSNLAVGTVFSVLVPSIDDKGVLYMDAQSPSHMDPVIEFEVHPHNRSSGTYSAAEIDFLSAFSWMKSTGLLHYASKNVYVVPTDLGASYDTSAALQKESSSPRSVREAARVHLDAFEKDEADKRSAAEQLLTIASRCEIIKAL